MPRPNILILNPFGIGDVIFSIPLLKAIGSNHKDAYLAYICNKRAYEIIKSSPDVDEILIYEKDDYRALWKKNKIKCLVEVFNFFKLLRNKKFDFAIDLSLTYQSSFILRMAGIPRVLGLNYRNRGKWLTDKFNIGGFEDKHVIEYYLDLLKLLNIDPGQYKKKPDISATPQDREWALSFFKDHEVGSGDLVIGVIPGCGASWGADAQYRRWDRHNFAKVCEDISAKYGAKVILFGSASEKEICDDIVNSIKTKVIMACGKTRIGEFLALLERCNLIITNDGGPLHMAVAVGTKTISIFGPVDEKIYGPYPPDPNHIVLSVKDLPCRPCYQKFKYNTCDKRTCLSRITPADVMDAADIILGKNR